MVYTEGMKRELEETVRSIDGVDNILWRWDDWKGCNCLRFMVRLRAFRICFSYCEIPVAYFYLDGYWLIDVELGKYLPAAVKQIVNTLCILLEKYDTMETKKAIETFAEQNHYALPITDYKPEDERRTLRLAGAYIRANKIDCDKDGIMLQVFVALCDKTYVYDYDESKRKKTEERKRRKAQKKRKILSVNKKRKHKKHRK